MASLPQPLPAARSDSDTATWTRRFWWMMGLMLLVRGGYAAVFPLDLAPDESYYWDWGRRLDYGYYSKPPMIGWLMALAGWVGRDSMVALKFSPGLLSLGGLVFIFLLGRDMFGARAGFWASALLLATPAFTALGTFFTIDAPLLLCWSASLWAAWRWWRAADGGTRWLCLLSVSLGLGGLTKQIHLVFLPLLIGFVLGMRRTGDRRPLGPLALALGISLLFLTPPVVWNWQHDWITFRHTASELEGSTFQWRRSVKFVLEFLGGQAGLGGGLTWILMLGAGLSALARWREVGPRERFLLAFFLPGLAAFGAVALIQRVEQNWPLVFYPAGMVLLAGRALGQTSRAGAAPRALRIGVALGAVLATALLAVPFVVPGTSLAGARSDPTSRLRGWHRLAGEIDARRGALPRPEATFLLAPSDRYVASALAYYLPDQPRTYCWEDPRLPESQYGIWGRPLDKAGWDGLVITTHPQEPRMDEVRNSFRSWEPLGEVPIRLGGDGGRDRRYHLFLGRGFTPDPGPAGSGGGNR